MRFGFVGLKMLKYRNIRLDESFAKELPAGIFG